MNYGLYFSGRALQWRFPLAFQFIFPLVVGSVLPFLPESPRWLLLQDRHEALAVIASLTGKNVDIHDPEVTAEFSSIKKAFYQEREDRVLIMDFLHFATNRTFADSYYLAECNSCNNLVVSAH
jgi:hypothetical protein